MLAKNWRLIMVPIDLKTFQEMKTNRDNILEVPDKCYKKGIEIRIVISAEFRKPTKFKRSNHASISSLDDMESPLVKRKKMIINHVKTLLGEIDELDEIDFIDFNSEIKKIKN